VIEIAPPLPGQGLGEGDARSCCCPNRRRPHPYCDGDGTHSRRLNGIGYIPEHTKIVCRLRRCRGRARDADAAGAGAVEHPAGDDDAVTIADSTGRIVGAGDADQAIGGGDSATDQVNAIPAGPRPVNRACTVMVPAPPVAIVPPFRLTAVGPTTSGTATGCTGNGDIARGCCDIGIVDDIADLTLPRTAPRAIERNAARAGVGRGGILFNADIVGSGRIAARARDADRTTAAGNEIADIDAPGAVAAASVIAGRAAESLSPRHPWSGLRWPRSTSRHSRRRQTRAPPVPVTKRPPRPVLSSVPLTTETPKFCPAVFVELFVPVTTTLPSTVSTVAPLSQTPAFEMAEEPLPLATPFRLINPLPAVEIVVLSSSTPLLTEPPIEAPTP